MDVKTDDAEDSCDSDDLFDNVTSPVKNAVKMTIKVRSPYFPIKKKWKFSSAAKVFVWHRWIRIY